MSKVKQQEMNKMANAQIKYYVQLANDDHKPKVVQKNIRFKNKHNQRVYELIKDTTIMSLKQYVMVEQLIHRAKKEGVNVQLKEANQLMKEWKVIKTKVLPKFNGSREAFASYVAVQRISIASLTKDGMSQLYETTLKQNKIVGTQLAKLKKTLKEQYPKMQLSESQELTEADIKTIIKAPWNAVKKAFKAVIMALIEGWLFVVKSLSKVAKKIQEVFKIIQRKFEGMIGRGAEAILSKINPDLLNTVEMIAGSKEEIKYVIGGVITKGVFLVLTFLTGAAFWRAASLAYFTTNAILERVVEAGVYAEVADTIIGLMKELNQEYFDDIMADLD